jgi:hypothetical protein
MQSALQPMFNVDELRAELRKMDDVRLSEFGQAARYMAAIRATTSKPSHHLYEVQLQEAKAEWRRRHPKNWQSESVKEHQS